MSDLFEKASKQKLRFNTARGSITTEDVWDLPLRSEKNFSLDILAISVNKALKESSEESFVEAKTTVNAELQLKLDIIKHIIKVKLADQATRFDRIHKKRQKDQILALIADKENDELRGKSKEDLLKMVADL